MEVCMSRNGFDLLREDITNPFAKERFSVSRLPVVAGNMSCTDGSRLPCCLDMLVKTPGGEISIPEPYASSEWIREFLTISLGFEDGLLPGWRDTHYAYLTVDNRFVRAGRSHRNGGWHFDGMQGVRYPEKLNACHEYIVADRLTTEFTSLPTTADDLDELRHNWFEELGRQIPETAEIYTPQPFEIVVMSAYQLHRSRVANEADQGWRSFIRLDISLKQQDRLGNTINPVLKAPFEYVPRDLPEGLKRPVEDAGWGEGVAFLGQQS